MDLFDIQYALEQTRDLTKENSKQIEFFKKRMKIYWKCKKCGTEFEDVKQKEIETHLACHVTPKKEKPIKLGGISKEMFMKLAGSNFVQSHGFTTITEEEAAKDFEKYFKDKIEFDE